MPNDDSLKRLAEFFEVQESYLLGNSEIESILIVKNRKLLRQKNCIISILCVLLALVFAFLCYALYSITFRDYNPFKTKVIDDVKYTYVKDGSSIFYRVDGIRKGKDVNNYKQTIVLENEIDGLRVTAINDYAFEDFSVDKIVLNQNLETIGTSAFLNASIGEIVFNDSQQSIQSYAFAYSSVSSIRLPDQLTEIQSFTFYGCDSLSQVTIETSMTTIYPSAFALCPLLETVELNGPAIIRELAFYFTGLTHVSFNNPDITLQPTAFYRDPALASVSYNGSWEKWNSCASPIALDTSSIALRLADSDDFLPYVYDDFTKTWICNAWAIS